MSDSRWSDDRFLDSLRQQGDALADECFGEISAELHKEDFSRLFEQMNSNDEPLPNDVPEPLRRFFSQTTTLPLIDGGRVDMERLERGERVFMTHAFPSCMALLAKSLPEGYAAPCLSKVLCLSGNLRHHPYRRLLGVLQMLVNVSAVGGFEEGGRAIITAPKIRLLHAGIRHIVRKQLPDYEKEHGWPVNLEDMLGTIMGFSYLVITGLKALEVDLEEQEAEDLYYLWRVFAQMMGIHPEGEPDSSEYVPPSLAAAAEFYHAYARRHYVDAANNPEGVCLAKANLRMLNDLLPQTPLRRLGMQLVPRIYMEILMGREGLVRVGIKPVRGLFLTKWLLRSLPHLWMLFWDMADKLDRDRGFHENLSRIFFQGLIDSGIKGEVTFQIPDSLADLRKSG